ncbi:MAG: hypothetical protein MJ171_07295 [Clostridia bacterium]|nr:hypothetical protein [Clostridia bacterium]
MNRKRMVLNSYLSVVLICIMLFTATIFQTCSVYADEREPEWFPDIKFNGYANTPEIYSVMGSNTNFCFIAKKGSSFFGSSTSLYNYSSNGVPVSGNMIEKSRLTKTENNGKTEWKGSVTYTLYGKLMSSQYGSTTSAHRTKKVEYFCYCTDESEMMYSVTVKNEDGSVCYEILDKPLSELPSEVFIDYIVFSSVDFQYGGFDIRRQIDSSLGISDLTSTWVLSKKGSSGNLDFYNDGYAGEFSKINGSGSKTTQLKTNTGGALTLNEIPFGTYVLKEVSSNVSNAKLEEVEFTIGPFGLNRDSNGNPTDAKRYITVEFKPSGGTGSNTGGGSGAGNENGGSGTGSGSGGQGTGTGSGGNGNSGTGSGGNGGTGTGQGTGGSGAGNSGTGNGNSGSDIQGSGSGNGNSAGNGSGNTGNGAGSFVYPDDETDSENTELSDGEDMDNTDEEDVNLNYDLSSRPGLIERLLQLLKNGGIVYYMIPILMIVIIIILSLKLGKKKK